MTKRCMKKNLTRVLVLCTLASIAVSGCGKNASSPDELNQSIPTQLEEVNDVDVEQVDAKEYEQKSQSSDTQMDSNGNTTEEDTSDGKQTNGSETTGSKDTVTEKKEEQNSAQRNDISSQSGTLYAISEETETYIDNLGIQTIEKKYVIPYGADIKDIAPATITINNVQYAIDSIVNPLNLEEKKFVKEQIAETEEEAKKFADELEYDDTDGAGVLTLDPDSVKVELNKDEKIPSSVSMVKTYDMSIKDQDQIPQTLKANGITYYQRDVTWANMGDPGTGINGTDDSNSAYGTYQTVASSWRATVSYYGTAYTEDKDYKGTATYTGQILVKNSPTNNYVVTYKPNSIVSNASGIYYNNYVNSMYQKENNKLGASAGNVLSIYSSGYGTTAWKVVAAILGAVLMLMAFGTMYVANKVVKKWNEEPEEVVAAVNDEELPVEIIEKDSAEDTGATGQGGLQ